MEIALTEYIWAPLLAALGVLAGWWLRRWSEESVRRASPEYSNWSTASVEGGSTADVNLRVNLSSRAAFTDDVRRRVAEYKRNAMPFSVLLMRIELPSPPDKPNQSDVSDAMTQLLRAVVRGTDHIAHYDERTLSFVLPGADEDDASLVAQRLSEDVSENHDPSKPLELSFSVSFATTQVEATDTAEDLLRRAEMALRNTSRLTTRVGCAVPSC